MTRPDETRSPHVMPRGDLIEHGIDEDCPCGPTPQFEAGGVVYVHHSLDNREAQEQK